MFSFRALTYCGGVNTQKNSPMRLPSRFATELMYSISACLLRSDHPRRERIFCVMGS
ncbi:MAG TPA: hypothetical protein VIU02_08605 [Burkholderiales bacterium]